MAKKKTVSKTKYDNLNNQLKSVQADLTAMTQAYNEATNAIAIARENTRIEQEFNSSEAQKARDWQTEMSNTSHQREVADLKKAGLNPVLSANSGAQSYTTSAASAGVDSSVNAVANMYNTKATNDNSMAMNKANINAQLKIAKMSKAVGLAQAGASYANAGATVAAANASAYGNIQAAKINAKAQKYNTDYSRSGSWAGLIGSTATKAARAKVSSKQFNQKLTGKYR